MDPLTALSVAGTIVQFADFGIRLFSESREIYKSQDGTSDIMKDIQKTTESHYDNIQQLKRSVWLTESKFPLIEADEDHRRILELLCTDASTLAGEIIQRLKKIRVKGADGCRWKSFRQALKSAWSNNEIASLLKRLSSFKEALSTRVLFSIRADVNAQSIRTSEHFDSLDVTTKRILSAIMSTTGTIRSIESSSDAVLDKAGSLISLITSFHKANREEHLRTRTLIKKQWGEEHTSVPIRPQTCGIEEVLAMILEESPIQESMVRKCAHKTILRSLHYPTMTNRYEDVREAYPETFDWAFQASYGDSPWDNLGQWLKTGHGIYWVNGKAGSGKSTLMKYIFDDDRLRECLNFWSRAQPESKNGRLCIATFYFWNSGTPEQQSQTGLLRTLLFQIFDAHPELVQLLLPELWARSYNGWLRTRPDDFIESWPLKKLLATFRGLLRQVEVPLTLFLLIDGLDEFGGDPEAIVHLLIEATDVDCANKVKICLSSRPWVIFEDSFRTCPKLRLQDLTRDDIEHYVYDSFRQNSAFQTLEMKEPEMAPRLLKAIVDKADGVFLWVRIVVKSLLEGVRNRDDMNILHERLNMLPPELEPLYEHLLSRIEPIYARWASKAFQILRACQELSIDPFRSRSKNGNSRPGVPPLSIEMMLFAINEDIELDAIAKWDGAKLVLAYEDIDVQLKARCAGFLEVPNLRGYVVNGDALVEYLHRTVRDFLGKKTCWSKILSHTGDTNFNPYVSLMRATYLRVSRWHLPADIGSRPDTNALFSLPPAFIIFAYYANSHTDSHDSQAMITDGVDDMWTRGAWPNGSQQHISNPHWIKKLLCVENIFTDIHSYPDMKILQLATFFGLSGYIRLKLAQPGIQNPRFRASALLSTLLRSQVWTGHHPAIAFPPLELNVVATLLQHGADPNWIFGIAGEVHATPWGSTLYCVWRAGISSPIQPELVQTMKLLAQFGANPLEKIRIPCEGKSYSAVKIISLYLSPRFPLEAAEILQLLEHGPVTRKRKVIDFEYDQNHDILRQEKHQRIA